MPIASSERSAEPTRAPTPAPTTRPTPPPIAAWAARRPNDPFAAATLSTGRAPTSGREAVTGATPARPAESETYGALTAGAADLVPSDWAPSVDVLAAPSSRASVAIRKRIVPHAVDVHGIASVATCAPGPPRWTVPEPIWAVRCDPMIRAAANMSTSGARSKGGGSERGGSERGGQRRRRSQRSQRQGPGVTARHRPPRAQGERRLSSRGFPHFPHF
jgi:hypothetical protein